MTASEEADITTVSGKGQVVIPQTIRVKHGIGPGTRLLVYGYEDVVIMKKMDIPDVTKDLQRLYRKADQNVRKYGLLSDAEILEIIQGSRRKRKSTAKKSS